ncbi:predicted protein [Sclerotinia sclerotiorum 1980 UF-70]|uniref:Uncharacterized protein n=2 Tax=Sclerotinia sclerotiorum (strain ATCC 18683 / 1980 / Ss-1) TaxID=665079 RepID=A7EX47_SCLS1|nr:predicted protein [Sclerotinia sclerotiorum 1980 UF-70]APA05478.1 hypothetical protein sscle_01g002480 [Sclerotinia sclerotiorum 1980 UF-70]EDN94039.1 predicted protein [Sclerotinia sclerotiorum 1980 UF-70]
MAVSEVGLASEKYIMLLKDSVPDEDPTIPLTTTSSLSTQPPFMGKPPLPALAVEVLWYSYEKKFNEFLNIPYSPFIIRLQQLSASLNNNNIYKAPTVPKISPNPLTEKDLQDAKHKMIAQLVKYQTKRFENVYGSHDKTILSLRFGELDWYYESHNNALIDFYGARNDQIELDTLRVRAWQAGARWRHVESEFLLET